MNTEERACRVCGCTQNQACVDETGPCWWVEPDLCSHCPPTAASPSGIYGKVTTTECLDEDIAASNAMAEGSSQLLDSTDGSTTILNAIQYGRQQERMRQARHAVPLREAFERKVGEAYQVIGMLLEKTGDLDTPEGQRALDYFADELRVEEGFLPWPSGNHDEWLKGRPTHRHKKRNTKYVLIGFGRMQAENWLDTFADGDWPQTSVDMRDVAIYRAVDDGSLWARPKEEFEDGRFEVLTELPAPSDFKPTDPPRSGSATREDAGAGGVGRPSIPGYVQTSEDEIHGIKVRSYQRAPLLKDPRKK